MVPDVRNGRVALIAGQPAVPNTAMTLSCPLAKSFECVRTAEPKCARIGSPPQQPPSRIALLSQVATATFGHDWGGAIVHEHFLPQLRPSWCARPCHANRPEIFCRASACPAFCTFCCSRQPSSCPRMRVPACSNLSRPLSSLAFAVARRRERQQLPPCDCESARGCHGEQTDVLIAARGELARHVWVMLCRLNRARSVSTDV